MTSGRRRRRVRPGITTDYRTLTFDGHESGAFGGLAAGIATVAADRARGQYPEPEKQGH